MKRILLVTGFLILLIGTLYSQDTISHIISGCVSNEKSTINEAPCPPGVFFDYNYSSKAYELPSVDLLVGSS